MTHGSLQFISQNNKREGRSDITGKGKCFGVVLSELITASSEERGRRTVLAEQSQAQGSGKKVAHRKSNYERSHGRD